MSIENVLAVIGATTPIIAFGVFICARIEYNRKKGVNNLKKRMSLTLKYEGLFLKLGGFVSSTRTRRRLSIERAEIERYLLTKEPDLQNKAPSKATREMRGYLNEYFIALRQGSSDEVTDAEERLIAQLDHEAEEYQNHRNKYDGYYRAVVLAVAAVFLVIIIVVGVAVAAPFIKRIVHDLQGHAKSVAVHQHKFPNPSGTPVVKYIPPFRPSISGIKSSSGKSRIYVDAPADLLCVMCITEQVTGQATRILSGASSSLAETINDLGDTANGTVGGLAKTANGTVNTLGNAADGTIDDLGNTSNVTVNSLGNTANEAINSLLNGSR